MNSVYLTIAGLHFKISASTTTEVRFLRKKYRTHLSRPTANVEAHVVLQSGWRKKMTLSRVTGNTFLLRFASLTKNFQDINYPLKRIVTHALLHNNGLALHASSFIEGKRAYIFIGQKGAGKSTVRRLGEPRVSLGDDIALVRKVGKTWYVFGSPFYMRTNRAYPNVRRKITGFCTLRHEKFNAVTTVEPAEQIKALIENSWLSFVDTTTNEKKRLFTRSAEIIETAPVAQFSFRKEKQALTLISYFFKQKFLKKQVRELIPSINPGALPYLPAHPQWALGITSPSFFQHATVLSEPGWNFEFDKRIDIPEVARSVQKNTFDSSHTRLIKKKMENVPQTKWFIFAVHGKKYMCIDGNHSAVALWLTYHSTKKFRPVCVAIASPTNK